MTTTLFNLKRKTNIIILRRKGMVLDIFTPLNLRERKVSQSISGRCGHTLSYRSFAISDRHGEIGRRGRCSGGGFLSQPLVLRRRIRRQLHRRFEHPPQATGEGIMLWPDRTLSLSLLRTPSNCSSLSLSSCSKCSPRSGQRR